MTAGEDPAGEDLDLRQASAASDSPRFASEPGAEELPHSTLSWHSKFSERRFSNCLFNCSRTESVQRDEKYQLILSLGRFQPEGDSTLETGSRFNDSISQEQAREGSAIYYVVPIFSDDQIFPPQNSTPSFELELERQRLFGPVDADVIAARKRGESDEKSVEKIAAGSVTIPFVVAKNAGTCSRIALSIWDKQLETAVDSLVVAVPIGSDDGCGIHDGKIQRRLYGGAETLLSVASSPTHGEHGAPSVGMHVFEFRNAQGVASSYAVFATKFKNEEWIGGWQMQSTLASVIGKDGVLQGLIHEARRNLGSDDENVSKAAYAGVATRLKQAIFSGIGGHGLQQERAKEALSRLQETVKQSPETVTMLARFTLPGRHGSDMFYMPLRLLAAQRPGLLDKDFAVIQPLPRGTINSDTCISRWTILASGALLDSAEKDQEAVEALKRLVGLEPRSWLTSAKTTFKEMADFFGPPPGPNGTPMKEAEGVLVLAHHSAAKGLWFEEGDIGVALEGVTRFFPPGSVAVLGACTVASPDAADGLIKQLNSRNIDSMIVSPFPVLSTYAVRFTNQFINVLDAAYTGGERLTMRELFDSVIDKTAGTYDELDEQVMRQMGLEFVLAGNPHIRLCGLKQEEEVLNVQEQ